MQTPEMIPSHEFKTNIFNFKKAQPLNKKEESVIVQAWFIEENQTRVGEGVA